VPVELPRWCATVAEQRAPAAPRRLLAALSGGVDSAVAAARVVDAGHDVVAVHLALSPSPAAHRDGARGCCTLDDARDARRIADRLGIPFYVWDLADRFREDVMDDFAAEYAAGRTPNPCLRCNERIKFAAVLERGRALGFDAIVTGHHARLDRGALRRSVDAGKDQSYVLASLRPDQLAHAVFPLGDSTKAQVRAEAARRGLGVAAKPDSHDICFIPDGDTAGWLRARLPAAPGPIRDLLTGRELGRHDGTFAYTVGQRRGLGLSRPAADGRPRYVLGIEPAAATVTVGPRESLLVDVLETGPAGWLAPQPPPFPVRCRVQLRAHGSTHLARASAQAGGLRIVLDDKVDRVAPGQLVALYDEADELVLGAARLEASQSSASDPAPAGGRG
jgi:tRNA-specific 2-thiouridylase